MSNGEQFFRANKPTRQEAFSFQNQDDAALAAEIAGDQGSRVYPAPVGHTLAPVGHGSPGEPSPESAADEAAGRI